MLGITDLVNEPNIAFEEWMTVDVHGTGLVSHSRTMEELDLEKWMVEINSSQYYIFYCM